MNHYLGGVLVLLATTILGSAVTFPRQPNQKRGVLISGVPQMPSISFDDNLLLSVDETAGTTFSLSDINSGKRIRKFEGHLEDINSVTLSPDGKLALSGAGRTSYAAFPSKESTARLWDVSTGKELKCFEGHTSYVYRVMFIPHSTRVVTASTRFDT